MKNIEKYGTITLLLSVVLSKSHKITFHGLKRYKQTSTFRAKVIFRVLLGDSNY